MDLSKCRAYVALFFIDVAHVEAVVPPAYDPVEGAPGHVPVRLMAVRCEAIILDNQTVVEDAAFATVSASVVPGDGLASPEGYDGYVIEAFASHEPILIAFREAGFPIRLASIDMEWQSPGPARLAIASQGIQWYVHDSQSVGDRDARNTHIREHHEGAELGAVWFDGWLQNDMDATPSQGLLQADSGWLQTSSSLTAGIIEAASNVGTLTGVLQFDFPRLESST